MFELSCFVGGRAIRSENRLAVTNPYDGSVVGSVALADRSATEAAIVAALQEPEPLTRYRRFEVLDTARRQLVERAEEFAHLITAESGLCVRETRYEVGRACDVLQFAAMEALKDDGQIFSC